MLSLGKWLSSKARLLLVLFTGLGRIVRLNYLRFPLVNTTETRRMCVCVQEVGGGQRTEDRNDKVGDTETEKKKQVSHYELLHH